MKIEGVTFLHSLLRSHYGKEEQAPLQRAVLEATWFIDPSVVAQTQLLPIIRSRRMISREKKNTVVDGEFVSDNFPPDYVFRAATDDTRHQGSTQLCHIYGGNGEARDTYFYTNLANLCLMPSFLAKFADTEPAIVELLKDCAFALFGFDPLGVRKHRPLRSDLRAMLKTATPPKGTLFDALLARDDVRFRTAKAAGFVFSSSGEINASDPWLNEMIKRRDGSRESRVASSV